MEQDKQLQFLRLLLITIWNILQSRGWRSIKTSIINNIILWRLQRVKSHRRNLGSIPILASALSIFPSRYLQNVFCANFMAPLLTFKVCERAKKLSIRELLINSYISSNPLQFCKVLKNKSLTSRISVTLVFYSFSWFTLEGQSNKKYFSSEKTWNDWAGIIRLSFSIRRWYCE